MAKNNNPCILFNHFGIAEDDIKGNYWFEGASECALLGNRKEIKKILENDSNIIAVFSGHQHWTKHLKENGIDNHVVGSLTEDVKENGVCDGVYFIVELDERNAYVEEEHMQI